MLQYKLSSSDYKCSIRNLQHSSVENYSVSEVRTPQGSSHDLSYYFSQLTDVCNNFPRFVLSTYCSTNTYFPAVIPAQWLGLHHLLSLWQHCLLTTASATALLGLCTVLHQLPPHVHLALRIQPTAPHS